MSRKTITVEALLARANKLLNRPEMAHLQGLTPDQAFRRGVTAMLEDFLHQTGNYQGFKYQDSEVLPPDERKDDGFSLRDGYDETRRIYN